MPAINLLPLGAQLEVAHGDSLETALVPYGVEFPCGGAGVCRGCRVRVIQGAIAVTPEMEELFTPEELAAGWRLACCSRVEGPLTLEIAQWETPILSDDSQFAFEPADGLGIAIDLGTTTLVAQALDLATGEVLGVETALNPQAAWGADLMSRVQHAVAEGAGRLTSAIREMLGAMVGRPSRPTTVLIAGNTVMHHLFCGADVAPLSHAPFHTEQDGERILTPIELGWDLPEQTQIRFLPCLGGFVGSDILAGILATGMAERSELSALIDLGTNGEIALGSRERILCASTAAGPAFEAGRIRMGMRASSGAISHVAARNGSLECRVIGGGAPRGICGSGLVDAAAAGLELGHILPNGRLANGVHEMALASPVALTQNDIRELQLAKGAIAAGLRILAERFGAVLGDVCRVHLAGAFGNYVNIESARRIGLLEVETGRIHPDGNTSLRGVKMALLAPSRREEWIAGIRARVEHVPLAADAKFQETFVDCLAFP